MLTDIERENYFSRKKKEVIERLLGSATPYHVSDDITTRLISPIGKLWFNENRIYNDPYNATFSDSLHNYNEQLRINHGRYVVIEQNEDEDDTKIN